MKKQESYFTLGDNPKHYESERMTIVEYNEKSFAVIGEETILYRDELSELHGTYNPHLKCGPGWIFSNKRLDEVKNLIMVVYAKGPSRNAGRIKRKGRRSTVKH